MGPHVPLVGFYYPQQFVGEMTPPYVNLLTAIYGVDPIHDPTYAAHIINSGIYIVLIFGFTQDQLLNTNGSLDTLFNQAKAQMAPGLLSRVLGVSLGDELFLALHGGTFDNPSTWPDLVPWQATE